MPAVFVALARVSYPLEVSDGALGTKTGLELMQDLDREHLFL